MTGENRQAQINEKRRKIFKAAGIAGLAGFIGLAIPKAVRGAVYFREDDGSMKNLSNLASTKQANTWTQAQTFQGTVSGVGNKVTFSDTATNIPAGGDYNMDVDLGKTGYKNGIVFLQQDPGGSSGNVYNARIVFSDTNGIGAYTTSHSNSGTFASYSKLFNSVYLTHRMFSTAATDVSVGECYINGQNLRILFSNKGSVTRTLSVYGTAIVFPL